MPEDQGVQAVLGGQHVAHPALDGCRPIPQIPQSIAAPPFISVSMYIAWCER